MGRKLNELGQCEDIVKALLLENPKYRDSDEALLAKYYAEAAIKRGMVLKTTPISTFLNALHKGQFHSADDITRARRKVQEKFPETRGDKWRERHKEEKVVRRHYGQEARLNGGEV